MLLGKDGIKHKNTNIAYILTQMLYEGWSNCERAITSRDVVAALVSRPLETGILRSFFWSWPGMIGLCCFRDVLETDHLSACMRRKIATLFLQVNDKICIFINFTKCVSGPKTVTAA